MTQHTKAISYSLFENEHQLPAPWQELLAAAREAAAQAYAPYSHFLVGAALRLANGQIVIGNNQENSAYPSGMCAERTAFYHKHATQPGQQVVAVAVAARRESETDFLQASPCGACRQVMSEYEHLQGQHIPILMQHGNGQFIILERVGALLPFGFNKDML